jgi:hypothetical protein
MMKKKRHNVVVVQATSQKIRSAQPRLAVKAVRLAAVTSKTIRSELLKRAGKEEKSVDANNIPLTKIHI